MEMSRREAMAIGSAFALSGLGATASGANVDEAETFKGRVDDLDFLANQGWCQVILRNGNEQLVAVTKEHRMQTLLEVAFATGRYAEVAYKKAEPNELTRVKLNRVESRTQ